MILRLFLIVWVILSCFSAPPTKIIIMPPTKKMRPDLLIVLGDRYEILAFALSAYILRIPIAHIHGGEVTKGVLDDAFRHSITKLSHFHFVSNEQSKKRLIQMGEFRNTIFVIGSPDLDIMKRKNLPKIKDAKKFYGINFDDFSIMIFHPVTTNNNENKLNLEIIKKLISSKKNENFICINPNNDPGSINFLKLYKKLNKYNNFISFPSMRFEYFLTFLKKANYIIGNSSAGVREAPFYGIKCVNVGSRQNNRAKFSKLIYNSKNYSQVLKSINKINKIKKSKHKDKDFGSGNSDKKLEKILLGKKFWKLNIQKTFNDLDKI